MSDHYLPDPIRTGSLQILANRLMQLAADTDRAGLHQQATLLVTVAVSVLEGRRVDVRDA